MTKTLFTWEAFNTLKTQLDESIVRFILSDHVAEKTTKIFIDTHISSELISKTGSIIAFYLAGKIADSDLGKVLSDELTIDPQTGQVYAQSIISTFESDRESGENTQSVEDTTSTKKPTLADELLYVARKGVGDENKISEQAPGVSMKTSPKDSVPVKEVVPTPKPLAAQQSTPVESKVNIPLVPIYNPAQKKPVPLSGAKPTAQPATPTPVAPLKESLPKKTLDSEIMSHFKQPTPTQTDPGVGAQTTPPNTPSLSPIRTPKTDEQQALHLSNNPLPPVFKTAPITQSSDTKPSPAADPATKPAPSVENANKKSAEGYNGNDPYREPIT